MDLCPVCLENNKESSLINIGVHSKVLACKSEDCIYIEYEDINNTKPDSDLNYEINATEDFSDIECDLSTTDSEDDNSSLSNKNKLKFSKYQVLPIQRHLMLAIKDANKLTPIFNWFGFPIMLKFHIKVCYFLLIHLNLFDHTMYNQIYELRQFYYQCENIAFKIPSRLVSLTSYKFVKYLFDHHQIFKLFDIKKLNMSERILKSMDKFITALDKNASHRSIYGYVETCRSCGHKFSYLKEDFSIKLIESFDYIINNKFNYLIGCKKCYGSSQVEIKLERLADFLYIDCPRGVNKTFQELNEIILEKPSKNLKLQGIIELKCPDQFDDLPEKEPKIEEFIMKNAVKPKFEFRIHFRNTFGWHCVDTNSGISIDPISESDIKISPNKVKILVFAEINDPSCFRLSDLHLPIYKVLEQIKKPPKPMIKYPTESIKYWIILFKYRDHCLRKGDNSKSFLNKIATRITAKFNLHLKRRQNRIKEKFKGTQNEETFTSVRISDESESNELGETHNELMIEGNQDDKLESTIDFTELLVELKNNIPKERVDNIGNQWNNAESVEDGKKDIWSIFQQEDGPNIFNLLPKKSQPTRSAVREDDTETMIDQLISMKKKKRKLCEH